MSLRERLSRALAARLSPPPRYADALFLNEAIGLPSKYVARFSTKTSAPIVFFDYVYNDHVRARGALAEIERARRARGLSFDDRSLVLSASGLDPHDQALLALTAEFRERHVFFELWNHRREVVMLRDAGIEHLYFLPVSFHIPPWRVEERVARAPNRSVFVSLGGDDDFDLVREVIAARPDLTFHLPDQRFLKGATHRDEIPVELRAPNVVSVPCREEVGGTLNAYRIAFAACDTVLIATGREKRAQMRGGIRVADALRARKRIVMTRNGMCELLMAQHERTAEVAAPEVEAVGAALERTMNGAPLDEALYEEIRRLTEFPAKLAFMMRARAEPERFHASPFFRDAARIERDLLTLWASFDDGQAIAIPSLHDLTSGAAIEGAGARARVREIRRISEVEHQIDLAASRLIELVVSTTAGPRFTTTRRGHGLSYRGQELSRSEAALVARVAELL